ncbi:MAG: energy transducer TonB [Pseudomonadota bacterium]
MGTSRAEMPDDLTEIQASYTAWKTKDSSATRKSLFTALEAYHGDPTNDTVRAYAELLGRVLQDGRNQEAFNVSHAALKHFEPAAAAIPKLYLETRYIAAVSAFNYNQNSDAILELATVEALTGMTRGPDGGRPAWATKLYWQAQAWQGAMMAFYRSTDRAYPSQAKIDEIFNQVGYSRETSRLRRQSKVSELPFCEGQLIRRPQIRFPQRANLRGTYGAVIVQFDLDTTGHVSAPEMLAAVPFDEFEDEVLKAVARWRWKADDRTAVNKTCRLSRENLVQQVIFLFE